MIGLFCIYNEDYILHHTRHIKAHTNDLEKIPNKVGLFSMVLDNGEM